MQMYMMVFLLKGSSGVSNSLNDIKKYASNANVHYGFPIKGSDAKSGDVKVKSQVNDWLNDIGINIDDDDSEENILNDDSEENILNDDSSNENSDDNEINFNYDDSSYLCVNNLFLILLLILD